jgi:hypothetical protein
MNMISLDRPDISAHAVADRRARTTRAFLEQVLDSNPGAGISPERLAAAERQSPRFAVEHLRIRADRAAMGRRGEVIAIVGALTVLALVVLLCAMPTPLVDQAIRIPAAGLVIAMYRMTMISSQRLLWLNVALLATITIGFLGLAVPQAAGAQTIWDLALVVLAWGASGFRLLQMSEARRLDVDEMALLMAVQERAESLEAMRRKAAAAI